VQQVQQPSSAAPSSLHPSRPSRTQAKPSARRDLLLSIQQEQQKKWDASKVFEARAPAPGALLHIRRLFLLLLYRALHLSRWCCRSWRSGQHSSALNSSMTGLWLRSLLKRRLHACTALSAHTRHPTASLHPHGHTPPQHTAPPCKQARPSTSESSSATSPTPT